MKVKSAKKIDRQERVLNALIELYLESGEPVGSNTLKEYGLHELSPATIRNYFASLEEGGFVEQIHASGGRVPTSKAFKRHADQVLAGECDKGVFDSLDRETKEVTQFLRSGAEFLSEKANLPVFLSSPRFDHDLVLGIRLLPLDEHRCLCVLLTDFGSVLTEILSTGQEISLEMRQQMEEYFAWKLTGLDQPKMGVEAQRMAESFYKELMVRYITRYSSFSEADIYRTGFARLLDYPEFGNATTLTGGLSLFEHATRMRALLAECVKANELVYWIDEPMAPHCAVVAIPYFVHGVPVGAVGMLGPIRMPYRRIFGLVRLFSKRVSESLSRSLGKFQIHYRHPEAGRLYLEQKEQILLEGER